MKTRSRRSPFHVHFENSTLLGPALAVTEKQIRDAFRRHPATSTTVRVTLGADGVGFADTIKSADVLFGWRFPRETLARDAPSLRWIHVYGAGVEHLRPLDWLPKWTVLTNSRGVHGKRASEFLLTAILMLNNRIPTVVGNQVRRKWRRVPNTGIAGKTLLILGVGQLGGSAARLARTMGVKVIGIRRSGKAHPHVDRMYRPQDLRKVLPQADFVLCSVPLTAETEGWIGRHELDLLKPGAGFINVGRANIVDYAALATKLRRNELSGAILDVVNPEPLPPSSPLWTTPNLLITPHSSTHDPERFMPRVLDQFVANLRRFIAGRPLLNQVNRRLEY
jgi:phosphoglycerate dehydrogenase-like enzyme